MGRWLACVCGALVLSATVAHAQQRYDEVVLTNGARALGHLVANNPDGELALVTPGGELLRWPHRLVARVEPVDPEERLLDATAWVRPHAQVSTSGSLLQAELDELNAQAPRLGPHHTESRESTRVGAWIAVIASVVAGVAMVVAAVASPRVIAPGYGNYYDAAAAPYYPRVRSTGNAMLGAAGLFVIIVALFYGLPQTQVRDTSTPGPAPAQDFSVQRALGPSF